MYRRTILQTMLACALCAGITAAQAQRSTWMRLPEKEPPKWSVEIKAGKFEPEEQTQRDFYDGDTSLLALAVGYKILRTVEVGVEYGANMKERNTLPLPLFANADQVETRLTEQPYHIYALVRGIWGEDQIGVPYIGYGVTRMDYSLRIPGSPTDPSATEGFYTLSGTAEGSYTRYGLQFLLDNLDPSAAAEFNRDNGVNHLYLFIEKQSIDVDDNGMKFGGDATMAGLLFEF